jgi:WD40 repeat protein
MSVAFNPDGKSLAVGYGVYSGAEVGRVKVWDVASGTEIKAFTGPRGGVNAVAFHPDGKRLAVAGSEVVDVWDLETARKLHDLRGHKKWVYCLAYSPDGKWLATGGWDRTVKLRDAATGALALTIFAQEGFVLSLGFSPDSRKLVTTSEDRSIRLWDVPSGRRLGAFHGHSDFVQAVAFRPDGREVVTGGADASIRFWDLKTSRPVVVEQDGWISQLAFRRDGLRVLSGGSNVEGWNPFTGELDTSLAGTKFEKLPAGFVPPSVTQRTPLTSPDGKLVVRHRRKGEVSDGFGVIALRSKQHNALEIVEKASGRVVHTLTGHSADVTAIIFSPDGRRLATASYDRTVKLWDLQTGEDVFTLRGHTAGLANVAFSPDGNLIISGGGDNTARVWNATPLASDVIAKHDARYWKEIEALTHSNLERANDEARRAETLADAGQWAMAAEAFARAVEKDPGRLQFRFRLVDALLQAGDRLRVGPACDDILNRFGKSTDPLEAMEVAGLCRLALQASENPSRRESVHELAPLPTDRFQRAEVLAKFGQLDLVASGFAKKTESGTLFDAINDFFPKFVSLVAMGDLQGYRSAADKLTSSRASMPHPLLGIATWMCTFAPDAVTDLTVPVQMAEKCLAASEPAEQQKGALCLLGITLCRTGRIDEAIARLEMSEKSYGKESPPSPELWIYLAMAHHKKGNADEARRCLEKARSHKPAKPKKVFGDLKDRLLLKEAEELLSQKSLARP